MTNLIDDEEQARKLILREENIALHKAGVKIGKEPDDEQRVQVLGKLYEVVQQNLSSRLIEAISQAQATLGNYPHPLDALAMHNLKTIDEERRLFYEATYAPHVMKAHNFRS
ncbi:hypothetical protein [Variovorax sp. W2I14]|uniref:hypothetical protein n=1 Tax=Variovorax sp. W2I14 TaxID=3042290 RepID=UPI003D1F34BD